LSSSLVKEVHQKLPIDQRHLLMIKSSAAYLHNLINTTLDMAESTSTKPLVCVHVIL
jgi:hypothetical protein